jgi:predicted acyl esterase
MVIMSAAAGVGNVPGYSGQGLFYIGGITPLAWIWWYAEYGNQYHPHLPSGISPEERARLAAAYGSRSQLTFSGDLANIANHLPSAEILKTINAPSVDFNYLITQTPASDAWDNYDFLRQGQSTRVPGLHIDSWYTFQAYGSTRAYEYLSGNSPNQYLVMGPTAHCKMGSESEHTMVGDRDVGDARFDYESLIENWFDHWLRDEENATRDVPKVQYYPLSSGK